MSKFTLRYTAYAKAHGRTPPLQLSHDEESGSSTMEFTFWIQDQWRIWAAETGERHEWGDSYSVRQHKLFDAWLYRKDTPCTHGKE